MTCAWARKHSLNECMYVRVDDNSKEEIGRMKSELLCLLCSQRRCDVGTKEREREDFNEAYILSLKGKLWLSPFFCFLTTEKKSQLPLCSLNIQQQQQWQ
jgi:hypothetical protein